MQPGEPSLELRTVFASADPGLLAVAKSLLQSSGIPFLVRGMRDAIPDAVNVGDAFELRVRSEEADDARLILRGLMESDDARRRGDDHS